MATDSGASEPPLHKVQSLLDSDYGYPHGHLGYLAEHETEALDAFKKLAEEEELYKPGTPPSHDDTVLLYVLVSLSHLLLKCFPRFASFA